MMIDVDHFKAVNDKYGHPSGDAVLQDLKKLLDVSTRRSDLVARFGGEEFVIVIKGGPILTMKIAERIRKNVESRAPREEETMHIPSITVSIGVAHMGADDTPESMLKRADMGLYEAKRGGRNRVVSMMPSPPKPATPAL